MLFGGTHIALFAINLLLQYVLVLFLVELFVKENRGSEHEMTVEEAGKMGGQKSLETCRGRKRTRRE
jgi:hypothetical protein